MKTALQEIHNLTEGLADGAPDASELAQLCNRISSLAKEALHPSFGIGVELIATERERQITSEGWSAAHDDEHDACELNIAADCYLTTAHLTAVGGCGPDDCPDHWPFDESWWKPSDDPIRSLVKAGALIAAEIDRLQRSENGGEG